MSSASRRAAISSNSESPDASRTSRRRIGRQLLGRIVGDSKRIDLLAEVLGGRTDEGLLDTLLPKDLAAFRDRVDVRRAEVEALLREGRELVERVERLVCAVYDVPDDLTEQVVEHAVRRAG